MMLGSHSTPIMMGLTPHGQQQTKAKGPDHWRSSLDNLFIEFLASLFIIISAVMYDGLSQNEAKKTVFEDPWIQIIPSFVICAVMLCLKDGDCFFPDATPTVTLLMWSVGAYDNLLQPAARVTGHSIAAGVALWMCHIVSTPPYVSLGRAPEAIFVFEMMATAIEHMGAIYLFIPMLPSANSNGGGGHRVRAKTHHETEAPMLDEVMHAALAFAGIHWSLRICFMCEMNPLVTLVKYAIWNQGWEECLMQVWGQILGVGIAWVYIANYYSPRKQSSRARNAR